VDETAWAARWFADLGRRLSAGPAPLVLSALLADGPTRMLNYAVAVTDGTLGVHRGVFAASGR